MNNMMSRYPEFSVSLLGSLVAIGWTGMAHGEEYQFDPSLFGARPMTSTWRSLGRETSCPATIALMSM